MIVAFSDLPAFSDHVLVDGAFDPLHAGHISYLYTARHLALGPVLVAVASDDQIRAKGREPLLPQESRVAVMDALGYPVYAKQGPTENVIEMMGPRAYIKGKDWEGKLPPEQESACIRVGARMLFVDAPNDSSTARLRAWARAEDAEYLYRLERLVQSQQPASVPWQPVTDYSFEARKAIEGQHPQLIKDVFRPVFAFDVGCGPDEILCRLLREIGVHAKGMDPQGKETPEQPWKGSILHGSEELQGMADLIICREVLEHLTVLQVKQAVRNLCRLSSKFVYVTTRFAKDPASLLSVDTSDDLDPTHITMLSKDFLRTLFVLEGATRRADLEQAMDWQNKGRVLVYEV